MNGWDKYLIIKKEGVHLREHVNANRIQSNKNTFYSARRRVTVLLSLFVVLGVFWCLKLTGITLAGEAFCGKSEHRHDESCVSGKLICEQEETTGHIHDESCILKTLLCEQEEKDAHAHDENCQHWELICNVPEQEGHTHNENCRQFVLVCEKEEKEGHLHSDTCFEQSLLCTIVDDS